MAEGTKAVTWVAAFDDKPDEEVERIVTVDGTITFESVIADRVALGTGIGEVTPSEGVSAARASGNATDFLMPQFAESNGSGPAGSTVVEPSQQAALVARMRAGSARG